MLHLVILSALVTVLSATLACSLVYMARARGELLLAVGEVATFLAARHEMLAAEHLRTKAAALSDSVAQVTHR